jgi:hypothetical protein
LRADTAQTLVTNRVGGFANITWTGVAITLRGDKYQDHGMFQIILDGRPLAIGSGYSPDVFNVSAPTNFNQTLYASPKLPFGVHLLQYINLGRQDSPATGDFIVLDSMLVQITDGVSSAAPAASPTASGRRAREGNRSGRAEQIEQDGDGPPTGASASHIGHKGLT